SLLTFASCFFAPFYIVIARFQSLPSFGECNGSNYRYFPCSFPEPKGGAANFDNIIRELPSLKERTETESDEIFCIHWNCGGFVAQTTVVDPTKASFKNVIEKLEPDVVMLNELKANHEKIEDIIKAMGYSCYLLPSTAPN
ncbi:hypothetical protein PENTCL1PPCAC_10044, partial [Pristionchus entomophagus]